MSELPYAFTAPLLVIAPLEMVPAKVAFCDASNNKACVPTVKNFMVEPDDSALSSTLSLSEAFNNNLPLTVPASVR